ncbi:MAG: DUF5320 family protein [Candidatus Thermoplasmatota archaeon]|nr:DUF5320 family protein [Candidatus Thermoplasmatota archaeon]
MPGYDGTGPRGEGSMTGWGMGNCAVQVDAADSGRPIAPGYVRGRGYGRGYGRGFGFGRGRGCGRGFGRGGRGYGRGYGRGFGFGRGQGYRAAVAQPFHDEIYLPANVPLTADEEMRYLEMELKSVEAEEKDIAALKEEMASRLEELRKAKK